MINRTLWVTTFLVFLISISEYPAFSETNSTKVINSQIELLKKKLEANPKDTTSRKSLAKLYLRSGNYNEAIFELRQNLNLEDLESYMLMAAAYRFSKNYLDEIRILNLLTPKYPEDPKLFVLLAKAYYKIENYDEAIAKFKKALQIQPKYEEASWGIYKVYQSKKNNYESRLILEDMLKVFGDSAKIYSELCRLYSEDSFFEKSLENCELAVQLDAKIPSNHVYLGMTHKFKKDKVQAEKILIGAAKRFPKSAFAQQEAGELLVENENYEIASKYLVRCSVLDKSNLKCWKSLAKSQFQLARYKEALEAYTKTCKLDRSSIPEFKRQASVLRANGKSQWYDLYTQAITKCYY